MTIENAIVLTTAGKRRHSRCGAAIIGIVNICFRFCTWLSTTWWWETRTCACCPTGIRWLYSVWLPRTRSTGRWTRTSRAWRRTRRIPPSSSTLPWRRPGGRQAGRRSWNSPGGYAVEANNDMRPIALEH